MLLYGVSYDTSCRRNGDDLLDAGCNLSYLFDFCKLASISILLSIIGHVFVNDPLKNEPGFETASKKVIDLYINSFSKIHNFKKIRTVEEMQDFTKLIKNIKENHKNLEYDISKTM